MPDKKETPCKDKITAALDELYGKLHISSEGSLDSEVALFDDASAVVDVLTSLQTLGDFAERLKILCEDIKDEALKKKFYALYKKVSIYNPIVLSKRLRSKGFSAKNNQVNLDNLIYRLVELTRLGKREEVFGMLLRVYMSAGQNFPDELAEVFVSKKYPNDLWATFIYSYLSAFTENDSKQGENNE